MNKSTLSLPGTQGEWGSFISKYQPDSAKVLDNMFTVGSKNFVTDQTGMIDKRQGGVQWNRTSFGNVAKDSYEAQFESGARHFLRVGGGTLSASTGTGLFDTITAGYSTIGFFEWATYQDRVYGCNGINAAQVYDTVTSYGGVSYVFTTGKTKDMGAQAPSSAPTAGTPTAGGSVPVGGHKYKITFVYYSSEESNGSPASATQTTTAGFQTIPLSSIPIGGYGVTARNIYRDNNDGVFLLLDTLSNNTTTVYSDILAQGSTPTPIPQFNDTPPTFSKIALWLDSLWITPTGETNILRYSNAGFPDIFDPDNFVRCQSDDIITAITVYNGKLFVHGLHSFGSIEGTTPDTFSYHNISNNIGCTDNRSIQIRSIVSIPTLWWLSDKGLYYSNGYTVEYGSDFIQDLVNLNLAQVNYSTNKNTQTSFSDFSGDTITQGIDITSQPGAVTTINPKAEFNETSDWTGGSVTTNIKTSNANLIEVPTRFAPTLAQGTTGGSAVISGSNVTLPSSANFTGESSALNAFYATNSPSNINGARRAAQRFVPSRTGTVTSVTVRMQEKNSTTRTWFLKIWNDSLGVPGAELGSVSFSAPASLSYIDISQTLVFSVAVTAGVSYWFGVQTSGTPDDQNIRLGQGATGYSSGSNFYIDGGPNAATGFNSFWQPAEFTTSSLQIGPLAGGYVFVATAVASSGTWSSPVYDSGSLGAISASITTSGSYPTFTTGTITVYASANSNMSGAVTEAVVNPNGTSVLSLSGYRYWQIIESISTTDNVNVPTMGTPVLLFSITGIWVSQPIHATTDNTGWGTLTSTGNIPLGTSIVLEIATSVNNIVYSSFGPLSGAAVTEWAKVRLTLTTDSTNTTSPSVSSVTLTWTLSSTITSSAIDTGTTPAGFNTFQWEQLNFSIGTVTASIRTATTAVGLTAASYVTVTNGSFPNLTPLQFVQWKLVLTAASDSSPVITSVTVNWFVGTSTAGVRATSIFYNKTYSLSVATVGSTTNNVLIQLDQFGKWRIQQDNSIGTFLLYFNSLYFTDGISDLIYNGFIADTDNGTAIEMDVRTKAWTEKSDIFLKIPRGLKVSGIQTGTAIHAYYSVDLGTTWIEMLNEEGQVGFQTDDSETIFTILFVPNGDTLLSGRTLIYRMVSNDVFACSISDFEPSMYTRRARYLNNG